MNMITHHYEKEKLSAYVDKEIPADEARMIDIHLRSCPGCNRVVHNLILLSESIEQLPRPEADSFSTIAIMNRLRTANTINFLPLTRLFIAWGILSLLAMSTVLMIPVGNTFLRLVSYIYNEAAVLMTLMLHFSGRLPSGPVNIIIGFLFMMGALLAFYGFSRVYLAMDQKELLS